MSAASVIEVRATRREAEPVHVVDGRDAESRYRELLALVLRMGNWLAGPQAALLDREEWERLYERYREHLQELRALGDALRPVTLRERWEELAGEALVQETLELFAA